VRYLSIAEAKRLINASDPDFRPLVQAALLKGARYGQLAKATVADFNADAGTIELWTRKATGHADRLRLRHVRRPRWRRIDIWKPAGPTHG
jgi:hypothetical protein